MRSLLGRFHRPMSRGLVNNMLTMNNLGDGSTLSLDFTTGVLDSRLTFTRSTTATYINSSGYVTTAAANAPRFDYSPTNIGEPSGLLIEGSAVNIVKYSNAFTSGDWYLGGTPATLTSNYAVGPDGVTGSAWRFQGALTNSVFSTPVSNGGAAHLVSIYAKSNTGSNQTFTVYNGSSPTTCTATNVWQRFVVPVAGTWGYAYFGTLGANQDILIWGAQSELGTSGASSYIPTGASQVTRNAEECRMTGTNFSSWFAGATEGVFFAEYEKPRKLGSQDYVALSTVYAPGALLNITTNTNTLWPSCTCWPTGGAVFPGGITTACPAITKRAVRWFDGNDFTNFADGVVGTTSNGTGTLTMTMLNVGASTNSGTSSTADWLNSCIKKIKFYPTALPNAEIQTLTTP